MPPPRLQGEEGMGLSDGGEAVVQMHEVRVQVEMNVLGVFTGVAGIELGLHRAGFRAVCYVENEPYAQAVLIKQMAEGNIDPAPIWDDIKTFDGKPWRGVVDCVAGGFPCQDISGANPKGKGLNGSRSGLWNEMRRTIGEVRPKYVLVENVANITKRGLLRVIGDLHEGGYKAAGRPISWSA